MARPRRCSTSGAEAAARHSPQSGFGRITAICPTRTSHNHLGDDIEALRFHFSKESTMFSNWFSGDEFGQYRSSPHKQRMDQVGSSLLELRYANDVIRQHLHEWLRFSLQIEKRGLLLPATSTDGTALRCPAYREDKCQPLPRSSGLCQNLPRHKRTRTVSPTCGCSSSYPSLVCPDSDAVFAVCANASRTGGENGQEVHPKVVGVRPVLGGRWHYGTRPDYARARS